MSGRLLISFIALTLAGLASGAAAQGTTQREPAATTAQPNTTATGQQRRRGERPASTQTQRRTNQPAQAQTARPAGGGLNLDLNGGNRSVNGATRRAGDAFAVSEPYASDAQMQRYTGRRSVQMPRAPVQLFQQDDTDSITGFRR